MPVSILRDALRQVGGRSIPIGAIQLRYCETFYLLRCRRLLIYVACSLSWLDFLTRRLPINNNHFLQFLRHVVKVRV